MSIWSLESFPFQGDALYLGVAPSLGGRAQLKHCSLGLSDLRGARTLISSDFGPSLTRWVLVECMCVCVCAASGPRNLVAVTPAAQHASNKKPPVNKCFEARDPSECSIAEDLNRLGDGTLASPSPQSWKTVGMAWACMDALKGNVAEAKKAWMSLLVPIGHLVKASAGGLVLASTAHGLLVLRLERVKADGFSYLMPVCSMPARRATTGWFLLPVADLSTVEVAKVGLLPPASMAKMADRSGDCKAPRTFVLHSPHRSQRLVLAAEAGFPNLTSYHLQRLVVHLGARIEAKKASPTVAEMARGLIRYVFPKADDAFVEAAMKRRGLSSSLTVDTALAREDVEAFGEVLDEDDFAELKKKVTSHIQEKVSGAAASGGSVGAPKKVGPRSWG